MIASARHLQVADRTAQPFHSPLLSLFDISRPQPPQPRPQPNRSPFHSPFHSPSSHS